MNVAIEKIRTSVFRVLAIHNSLDNTEKLKLKMLVELLDDNLVVVEFSPADELEEIVRKGYWNRSVS